MRDLLTAPARFHTPSLQRRLERSRLAKGIFLLALGCLVSASGHAQDKPCKVIPAGQDFWIRLTDPVSTFSSKIGSTVTAILIASPNCDDSAAFATRTTVEGHITHVRRVGFGVWHSSSAVTIEFNKLVAGPQTFAIKARVEEVANGRENVKAGVIKGGGGHATPQQIISEIKDGLYVTEFLGHGANLVTGDYSRGASGLWISGGELAYPVEEITVAGNLKEMFLNISEIGNDLEFRGAVACPTIRIDGLTVGGE